MLEGQMIKWSYSELVRAITCTLMLGFQNSCSLARLYEVNVGAPKIL